MSFAAAYENDGILIVDKPQGLATTPGAVPSLCEAVFTERPALAAVPGFKDGEGGLLNRLDNDTGGLVLFAKTDEAFQFYTQAMQEDKIRKTYLAVVHGVPDSRDGSITLSISHSAKSHKRMLIADGRNPGRGRALEGLTVWRLVATRPPFSLLEVEITKGVRHQIRVHLAAIGLPIVGDRLYNKNGSDGLTPRHLLYCRAVRLPEPGGGEHDVTVGVPFEATWTELAGDGAGNRQ
jgi:23S rRNA pseudouridine1911/1915/1917 synthase